MFRLKRTLLLRNVKSVQWKTLLIILPVTIAILLSIAVSAYSQSKRIIFEETTKVMQQQLDSLTNQIEKDMIAHQKMPEALAQAIEANFGDFALNDYGRLTEQLLDANQDTFGVGVFFEPKVQNPSEAYASMYSYKTGNGDKASTEDYSDPAYDYHSQGWYAIVGPNGEHGATFTPPYFDETVGITMVTASVPVFDDKRRFIGVATGDIDLTTIQKKIAEAKTGNTGRAFLLDAQGVYLAGTDPERIMKTNIAEDPNPSLAAAGAAMLDNEEGIGTFKDDDGLHHLYYSVVPSTQWKLGVVITDEEVTEPAKRLMTTIAVLSLAGVFVLAIAVFLYTRSMTNRINRFNRLSEAMAQGDFTQRVESDTADEFGTMADNFNHTLSAVGRTLRTVSDRAAQVSDMSRQLRSGAEETNLAARSVTAVIQEIASGAETQGRGAEDSARALEEMASGIQRIAESSSVASETTSDVSQRAQSGNELMVRAEEQMDVIRRSVDQSSSTIRRLADRSKEIQQIADAITEISTQTNLLALNASIEAARAGEQGRGFAVVAGEVKKLAEQTSGSAKQIAELIGMIQEETTDAVRVMDAGSVEVGIGSTILNEAGAAFQSILTSIQEVAAQVEEVSASAEQLSAGSQEVSAAVVELSGIAKLAADNTNHAAASSEQQLAAMEEIATSATELHRMMQELQSDIAKFKL